MKSKKPKKKTTNSDSIIVKPRRYKNDPIVTEGIFEGIQHRFTITASAEAWIALQNKCFGATDTYQYISKSLFNDLWPFINSAATEAKGLNNRTIGKTHFKEALKIEAALIYSYWMNHEKNIDKNLHEKERYDKIASKTYSYFILIWGDDFKHLGLRPGKEMSFLKGYIQHGIKLLKGSKKTIENRLGILMSLLRATKIKKMECYKKHRNEFELLWNITSTAALLMSNPKPVFKSEKQQRIKDILKQQIPYLF